MFTGRLAVANLEGLVLLFDNICKKSFVYIKGQPISSNNIKIPDDQNIIKALHILRNVG